MSNFEIDSHLHIMMEYADRGSLHDFIQSQTQNVKSSRVIDILRQLVSGLKYMHEKRILHRDLKTQNIFMTSRPQLVKIGDLGIAKVMTTHNQTVVGTCSYISPGLVEQFFAFSVTCPRICCQPNLKSFVKLEIITKNQTFGVLDVAYTN